MTITMRADGVRGARLPLGVNAFRGIEPGGADPNDGGMGPVPVTDSAATAALAALAMPAALFAAGAEPAGAGR